MALINWNFNMKNRPERIQAFLVIAISFFLLLYPAYFQYNKLIEIDFLSPNPTFENLDQEDLFADKQSKTKMFTLSLFPVISLSGFHLLRQLPRLSLQIFSIDQPVFILRC